MNKNQFYSLLVSVNYSRKFHCVKFTNGAPEGIRTPDPLLRRQLLYPTELQARMKRKKFESKLYELGRNYVKDSGKF